ncbi:MAG: UvrB/UvrC motif-containing protein [Brumimicrobium sp.]|nr:UvrB/UvrC motif-containing protein [Brumimicrobium sp.]
MNSKIIFLLLLTVLVTNTSFSQVSNKERIESIKIEIQQAVDASDFDKAASLKKELDIRLEIEEAVKAGDFDRAQSLKTQLNGGQTQQPPVSQQNNNNQAENSPIIRQDNSSTETINPTHNNRLLKKNSFYLKITPFIGVTTTSYFINNYSSYDYYTNSNYNSYSSPPTLGTPVISVLGGNKFMFGPKNKNFRAGLDMKWFDLNIYQYGGFDGIMILANLINPGAAFAVAFNDKIGLVASFNLGLSIMYGISDYYEDGGVGLAEEFSISFHRKKLNFGLLLKHSNDFVITDYGASLFSFQAFIGFQF